MLVCLCHRANLHACESDSDHPTSAVIKIADKKDSQTIKTSHLLNTVTRFLFKFSDSDKQKVCFKHSFIEAKETKIDYYMFLYYKKMIILH